MATIADSGSFNTTGGATPIVVSDQFAGAAAVYAALVDLTNSGTDDIRLQVLATVNGGTALVYNETFTATPTASTVLVGPFPTEDEFGLTLEQLTGAGVYAVPFSVFKVA